MILAKVVRVVRSLNVVACIVLSIVAALQFNHPETAVWAIIYGYAGFLSLFAALHLRVWVPALLGVVGYALVAWRLFPQELTKPWWEVAHAREAIGLASCAIWAAFIAVTQILRPRPVHQRKAPPTSTSNQNELLPATSIKLG